MRGDVLFIGVEVTGIKPNPTQPTNQQWAWLDPH